MANRQRGLHTFLKKKQLLGTSLVPKGLLRQEQLDKSAQALANYKAKIAEINEKMKAFNKTEQDYHEKLVELINKKQMIKLQPVELRIAYIPFEILKLKSGESNIERIKRSTIEHNLKVLEESTKIERDFSKKNPNHNYRVIDIIPSYRKTSIKMEVKRERK